jgi:diguanylate cyclase (GGDEF)-like protein/PAS domain S-box-containing protein
VTSALLALGRWRGGSELLVSLPVIYVLHRLGFAVPGNFWAFALLLCGGAAGFELVARWRMRNGPAPWADRANEILLTVFVTLVFCLSGWAPLLPAGFLVVAAVRFNDLAGSWRFTLAVHFVAMVTIPVGIALGVVDTYLPTMTALTAAIAIGSCVGCGIRALGMHATARAAAETAARRSEERFRTLIQDSWDVIVIMNAAAELTFVSESVQKVMGWSPEQYRAMPPGSQVHADDAPILAAMAAALAVPDGETQTELRLMHGDGTYHWHEVLARNLLDHPAVQGLVYNHRDISIRKQREDDLAYEASHDPLTGLANRTALRDTLAAWCGADRPVPGAVLFLDLDGFKQVNDAFGHAAGDEVLSATARVLLACVGAEDTVARLGGDEFAALLTGVGTEREATVIAERIIDRLARAQDGVQASIGIAMCEPGRVDARETLHRADVAMYDAKRIGDHGWVVSAPVAVAER